MEELARESPEIDCPGETIAYNCSIASNTEDLLLTWNILFPGNISLSYTYNSLSFVWDSNDLGWNTSTTLTAYTEEYIESILEITLLRDIETNGTKVECSIEDLDFDTVTVDMTVASM